MGSDTVKDTTRRQFQAACRRLEQALKAQSPDAMGPSINVVSAVLGVMAYDHEWRKDLGDLMAETIRRVQQESHG